MKRTFRKYTRKIKRFLTRKHGPLATWAWAAVAIVGYLIYRRRQAGQGWPWQSSQQAAGDVGASDGAATSPSTPPDLAYVPGGGVPVDTGGGLPSSGGDMSGLLAILRMILNRGNHKRHHHHHKHHGHGGVGSGHAGGGMRGPGGKKHRHRSHAHHRNNMGGRHHRHHHRGGPKGRPHWLNPHMKIKNNDPGFGLHQRTSRPMVGEHQKTDRPIPSHKPHREPVKSPPRPSSPPARTIRSNRKGH